MTTPHSACLHGFRGFPDITWSTWTPTGATGTGTLWYNDCTPDCASGQIHYIPNTTVTLTQPVTGANGQLVFSRILTNPQPRGYSTGPYHGSPEPMPTQPA